MMKQMKKIKRKQKVRMKKINKRKKVALLKKWKGKRRVKRIRYGFISILTVQECFSKNSKKKIRTMDYSTNAAINCI